MATERQNRDAIEESQQLLDQVLRREPGDTKFAEVANSTIDRQLGDVWRAQMAEPPPPDMGLAALVGLGPEAARDLAETRMPPGVQPYDETITSQRIIALADLYYIYQHEKIGVFRVVQKLQELFKAGTVRLSNGAGAFSLYQFDRREVLRYTRRDRLAAYRRAFGYGSSPVPAGSRPNTDFHPRFVHFVNQVALYWRDKRISDVIRERAWDPSFGSVAVVRRAGLDLRNDLKYTSFGHLNVMRVEVMQLLEEAFRILNSDDIKRLFGADNAWDVAEEVLTRYFNTRLVTSPRQRMAVTGRDILRWLAEPHILESSRGQFESLLMNIAEPSEEWLTSAQALGLAHRSNMERIMPWDRQPVVPARTPAPAGVRRPVSTRPHATNGYHPPRQAEYELEI